jgi:hypothetical protein
MHANVYKKNHVYGYSELTTYTSMWHKAFICKLYIQKTAVLSVSWLHCKSVLKRGNYTF